MNKVRTSVTIEKGLLTQAKIKADEADVNLSDVVEDALKAYLPSAMAVERTEQGTVFKSGPTISTMQPQFTTPANFGAAPVDGDVRWEPVKGEPGVPSMNSATDVSKKQY